MAGADLIPRAGAVQIRLAIPHGERRAFLQHLRTISERLPIAVQLELDFVEEEPTPDSIKTRRYVETTPPSLAPVIPK